MMRTESQQKNCLYPFLLVLCPLMLFGQKNEDPFPFTHIEYYGPEQGLNGALVYDVTQDSRGFLWFITDNGLNRFDGFHSVPGRTTQAIQIHFALVSIAG
jgi:hypothetical protein